MVDTIRGLVRPVLTTLLVAACIVYAGWELYLHGVTPGWLVAMAAQASGYWFASRKNNVSS